MLTPRQEEFIRANINADTIKLRLKHRGDSEVEAAIAQIELQRKAAAKFLDQDGVSHLPATLFSPIAIEQATSSEIAQFHASLINPGESVVDLTMGMGSDSVAFASVAKSVTAIEQNETLAAVSKENYADVKNLEIICADSTEWVNHTDRHFNVAFIDPARRNQSGGRVFNLHDCSPDVTAILPRLRNVADRLLVKVSPMLDISALISELPGCKSVYVVEQKGEVRELLADVDFSYRGEPQLVAVISGEIFGFSRFEEDESVLCTAMPEEGDCLYEPSPSIMKISPFKTLCSRFNAKTLSANSHLYFSRMPLTDFPGKEYILEKVIPYRSNELKNFTARYGNASVSVRNFPIGADALRKKLKVKENSQKRLIATTGSNGEPVMLLLHHTGH